VTIYEHLIVLFSFVFALALTHVLASATDLMLARGRVKFSALQALWMFDTLVLLLLNWLSLWDLHRVTHWGLAGILVAFVTCVLQYFACSLVSPTVAGAGEVDMEDFRSSAKGLYLGALLALTVVSMIANLVFRDVIGAGSGGNWIQQDLTIVPMVLFLTLALAVRARWAQWTAAVAMLVASSVFCAVFIGSLG
jgi:hypothetical protein